MKYNVVHIDEIDRASYLGSNLVPIRHTLGFRAAGTNAWEADTGGQLIPPHTEDAGKRGDVRGPARPREVHRRRGDG